MARNIKLEWDASESEVDGYNVYRGEKENSEAEAPINGPVLVKDNSYVDSNVDPMKVYFYKVSAVKDSRESPKSAEFRDPALPATPKNGKASSEDEDADKARKKAAEAEAKAREDADAESESRPRRRNR